MSNKTVALRKMLEQNGITVDSTMDLGPDTSVMYVHDPENKTKQVATVALVYAKIPSVSQNILSVTPLTDVGENAERVANYHVERADAVRYKHGKLSKKEYVKRVLSTWTPFQEVE